MKIFRWSYIVPRLVVILLLVCISEVGIGLVMKYALQQQGSASLGAKVDVEQVNASLLSSSVELLNLQVTDPRKPMTNLVQAESLQLDFETDALLRKKAIASQGLIKGLRFGTARSESGQLAEQTETTTEGYDYTSMLTGLAEQRATAWFDELQTKLSTDVAEEFESVRLAEEMRDKWPAKYDELTVQAEAIKKSVKQLQTEVKAAKSNPLRHAEFLASVPQQLAKLESKLTSLNQELKSLPQQIETDRRAIARARQHDEQLLRQKLQVESLDPETLSNYLLGEQITQPIVQMVAWLKWARQMMPADSQSKEATPARGVDILFAGCQQRPDVLIRSLRIEGSARLGGKPIELTGQISNFTTQPQVHGQPLLVEMSTSGALPIKLRGTIDRTQAVARDELFADCSGLDVPSATLGGSDRFRLAISQSKAQASVSLLVDGDRLSGDIQLDHDRVQITPDLRLDFGSPALSQNGGALAESLKQNLSRLPKLVTRVTVSGTLDEPKAKVWSTLGPAVAQAFGDALRGEVDQQANRLIVRSRAKVDAKLATFDQEIQQALAKASPALAEPAALMKQVAGAGIGSGLERLGAKLPFSLRK